MELILAIHIVIVIILIVGIIAPTTWMPFWIIGTLVIGLQWLLLGKCILTSAEKNSDEGFIRRGFRIIKIELTEDQATVAGWGIIAALLALFSYRYLR